MGSTQNIILLCLVFGLCLNDWLVGWLIDNLIDCLRENPKCLDDIKTKNAKGGERRISKTCVQNIIRYLLQQHENAIEVNT